MTVNASVVICAHSHDRWPETTASVESVRRQTCAAHEIFLVVDNNPTLLERARQEFAGNGVTVVANKFERGLCGGRMTGADLASGAVVVYLDDDAVAEPDWLEHLLRPYENPHVLGVGGNIVPLWRTARPGWFPPEFYWVVGCVYAGMPVGPGGRIRNPIGANMSMRADVLRETGGFTMKLGRWDGGGGPKRRFDTCDDTEFCIRASQHFPDGIWVFAPKARVHHVVPAQRATWSYFVRRCRMEGRAKAVISTLVGARDSLGSERRYVWTLASSFLRNVAIGRLAQAGAICVGLMLTSAAFAHGRFSEWIDG